MSPPSIRAFAVLLGLTLACAAVSASAQQTAPQQPQQQQQRRAPQPAPPPLPPGSFQVGVLDVQRVFRESSAGKSMNQQLSDLRSRYQSEVQKIEEQLRGEDQELGRQRSLLAPEAFAERQRNFEKKVRDSQRLAQERFGSFNATERQARDDIVKVMVNILNDIMQERGVLLIVDRGQTVVSVAAIDVTQDVLSRLDQRLKSVKVTPQPAPQATGPAAGQPAGQPKR